jgi:hypothetical protein
MNRFGSYVERFLCAGFLRCEQDPGAGFDQSHRRGASNRVLGANHQCALAAQREILESFRKWHFEFRSSENRQQSNPP